jgi:hypothetical protein
MRPIALRDHYFIHDKRIRIECSRFRYSGKSAQSQYRNFGCAGRRLGEYSHLARLPSVLMRQVWIRRWSPYWNHLLGVNLCQRALSTRSTSKSPKKDASTNRKLSIESLVAKSVGTNRCLCIVDISPALSVMSPANATTRLTDPSRPMKSKTPASSDH